MVMSLKIESEVFVIHSRIAHSLHCDLKFVVNYDPYREMTVDVMLDVLEVMLMDHQCKMDVALDLIHSY